LRGSHAGAVCPEGEELESDRLLRQALTRKMDLLEIDRSFTSARGLMEGFFRAGEKKAVAKFLQMGHARSALLPFLMKPTAAWILTRLKSGGRAV